MKNEKDYEKGHQEGYENGHKEGYEEGQKDGYEEGHKDGYRKTMKKIDMTKVRLHNNFGIFKTTEMA